VTNDIPQADPYAYWRLALTGPQLAPPKNPQPGFWRMENAAGVWVPVAIWWADGATECLVDGEDSHAALVWRNCAKYPVDEEQYNVRLRHGVWHDDPPPKPAPTLRNEPDDFDELMSLVHDLKGESETALELLRQPVADQETADRIGVWARKLGDIANRAEGRRIAEKEPHLAAGKAVDQKWKAIIDPAENLVRRLKTHVQAFLLAAKAAERERAARAAREAQEAWAKVGVEKTDEARAPLVAAAQAAEEASQAKNAAAGRTGMKVSLRTEKRGRIVDYAACLAAVADHADVREVVEKLAQRSVKGGNPLPGVEVVTVEKVV